MGDTGKTVAKVVKAPFEFLGLTGGPDIPQQPEPPPPPPEPEVAMPDPEDELLRQRKRQSAARRRMTGRAGTLLSERDTGGTLG